MGQSESKNDKIENAEKPKVVGRYVAIQKSIVYCIQEKKRAEKKISEKDLRIINDMLNDDDEYDKDLNRKEFEKLYEEVHKMQPINYISINTNYNL